jgi:hypothetical protein
VPTLSVGDRRGALALDVAALRRVDELAAGEEAADPAGWAAVGLTLLSFLTFWLVLLSHTDTHFSRYFAVKTHSIDASQPVWSM